MNISVLKEARKALEDKNYGLAMSRLAGLLIAEPDSPEAFVFCAELAKATNDKKLFELCRQEGITADAGGLMLIALHFVFTIGRPDVALSLLKRAHLLKPDDRDISYSLARAYGHNFMPEEALPIYAKLKEETNDFWIHLEYHRCALLCAEPDANLYQFVREGRKELNKLPDSRTEGSKTAEALRALDELKDFQARHEGVKNPSNHIRDRHFIQYGTACLDFMEESEEQLQVAGGRYPMLESSFSHLHGGFLKLKKLLKMQKKKVSYVVAMPNRDSVICGLALAKLFGVEFFTIEERSPLSEKCLLVSSVGEFLNALEGLEEIKKHQTLFCVSFDWRVQARYTPDVCMQLCEHYKMPWYTSPLDIFSTDLEGVEELAESILKSSAGAFESEFKDHFYFYANHRKLFRAYSLPARRVSFSPESPVKAQSVRTR